MKRFVASLFWVLLASGLLLSACSGTNDTAGNNSAGESQANEQGVENKEGAMSGEVTVWAWNVAAKSLEAVVPMFNEKYPDIKVTVEDVGRLDVYDKTTVGLAANGSGLPDVIQMESDRLPNYTSQFPDGFADLSEFGADQYVDKISSSKWPQSKVGGKIVAMPWDIGPTGVFYRVDLFEKAGVKAEDIKTWQDFIEAGKKINEATGAKMVPIDVAKDDALFRMMLNQQGTYYFNKEGQITLNSDKAIRAMKVIKQLYDNGLVANADGWNGTVAATKNGSVATVPFGVWYSGTIMDQAPELEGKWDVFLLPAFEEGGNRAANLGGSNLVVPSSSDNIEAAYKFVEFAMTNVEAQMVMLKEYGLFPSLLTTYEDPYFQEPLAFFNNKPIFNTFAEEVADIPNVYYTSDYARAFKLSSDAQAQILLEGTDVKQTLTEAAEKLKEASGREIK